MIRLGSTAIATMLAWAVLLAGVPSGVAWLCGADGLVSSVAPWDAGRLGTLTVMWAVMMAAMVLPCAAMGIALGMRRGAEVAPVLIPIAALLHWSLESTHLLGTSGIGAALVAAILFIELRKWTGPGSAFLPALQMIALQLLVDPMSVGWMAVVLLWMLADLLWPGRATILSAIQSFGRRPIVPLQAFD